MPERMSLRLNPVINKYNDYQGVAITPSTVNYGILNDVVNSRIQAKEKAFEKQTAVKTALSQAREQLHRDNETLAWFDNKAKDIEQKISDSVAAGNYNNTINLAIQTAGDLVSDTELTARIRNNTEYEQKMKELDDMVSKGVISEQTAKYIKKENPYSNNFQYDNEGNIIGSDKWDFKEKPVADLDINSLFLNAFKTIKPDQVSSSRAGNIIGKNGKVITDYGKIGENTPSNYNIHSNYSLTQVKPEEILEQAKRMLMSNPDWELQLKQMYGAAFNSYQENQNKLDSMSEDDPEYNAYKYIIDEQKKLFYKDGIPVKENNNTFMNYFNYQLFNSDQAKAYGYKIEETQNQLSSNSTSGGNGSSGEPSGAQAVAQEPQHGANVKAGVKSIISGISQIFGVGGTQYTITAEDPNQ